MTPPRSLILAFMLTACTAQLPPHSMILTSTAFKDNEYIPARYTCDGLNLSPPLEVADVPGDTESLMIIADDIDAPGGDFTHWTVWNIDPAVREIPEDTLPAGAVEGRTSAGTIGYTGPCPPTGIHQYVFTVYALDREVPLPPTATSEQLREELEAGVIASAQLTGIYEKTTTGTGALKTEPGATIPLD